MQVGVSNTSVMGAFYASAVNFNVTKRPHPIALRPFLPELDDFARHNHFNILHPILRSVLLRDPCLTFQLMTAIIQLDCVEPRVARGNFGGKTQL
jgi:hypothetical protein